MKKIIFACLLLFIILQTSIFVASATAQNITLQSERVDFDYYGESYRVDISDGEFSVDFSNEISHSGYITFYLYSPIKTTLSLWLYSTESEGSEINIDLKRNEMKLVNLPCYNLNKVKGIKGESESDYIVLSCLSLTIEPKIKPSCILPSIDICYDLVVKEDRVEYTFCPRASNGIKSFIVQNGINAEQIGYLVKTDRADQDYFLTATLEDNIGQTKTVSVIVPAKNHESGHVELSSGDITGAKGDIRFVSGKKSYTLHSENAKGMHFEFAYIGDGDLTISTENGIYNGFSTQNCYTFSANCDQIDFYSDKSFALFIKNVNAYACLDERYFLSPNSFDVDKIELPNITIPDITETGEYDITSNSEYVKSVYYEYNGLKTVSNTLLGKNEGNYLITYEYQKEDLSAVITKNLTLRDTKAPSVEFDIDSVIEYGDKVNLTSFIVKDNSEYTTTIALYFDNALIQVDDYTEFLSKVGKYKLVVTATDLSASQNSSSPYFEFEIKDSVAPVITEFSIPSSVEVLAEVIPVIAVQDLSSVTVQTSFIYDGVPYLFENKFTPNKLGEYTVTVICKDEWENTSQKSLTLTVKDTISPDIVLDGELKFDNQNFLSFSKITALDNFDEFCSLEIVPSKGGKILEIVGNGIFYDGYGVYSFSVTAKDSSGNSTQKVFTLNIPNPNANLDNNQDQNHDNEPTIREEGLFGCTGCNATDFSQLFLVFLFFNLGVILRKK